MLNHSRSSELTSAQNEGLGKLFVEWSNLEFLLGLLLSRLLFTSEFLGRTYSDEMSGVGLERAIYNALDIHEYRYQYVAISKEQADRIRKTLKDVGKRRELRNKFAHFLWLRVSDDEIAGYKMSGRPPLRKKDGESISIKTAELQKNYLESYALVEELKNLIFELPEVDEKINLANHSSGPATPATEF